MRATEQQVQVALRMPSWLYEEVNRAAERSGWDFSKQVRHELAAIRGKAQVPYMPQPELNFKAPTQDAPGRRKRKAA